jgi:hypothetical protein
MTDAAAVKRTHWVTWMFAAFGMLGVMGLIFVAIFLGFEPRHGPVKIADKTGKAALVVGGVTTLAGTSLIQMHISTSEGGGGSYSYREDDTRNILLLDKLSGESWRILPDNDRRIDEVHYLPDDTDSATTSLGADANQAGNKAHSEYYVLTIDRAENSREKDVLVGTLTTRKQAIVMQSIDGIDEMWMQTPSRIGMIVRDRSALYYRIVDVPTLKVASSARIAVD